MELKHFYSDDFLNIIDGKKIEIRKFIITNYNSKKSIDMVAVINDNSYRVYFENISQLKIDLCDSVFTIGGLCVINHKKDGWQDLIYEIYDYEDGILSFYCQEIYIFQCEGQYGIIE